MTHRATRHILVVDDDRAFRLSTCALLRSEGYAADDAASGQDALEVLKDRRYDLLLLDLKMPGIDGLQLIEALRIWPPTCSAESATAARSSILTR